MADRRRRLAQPGVSGASGGPSRGPDPRYHRDTRYCQRRPLSGEDRR